MSKDSKIEWTNHTFNPWVGCTKVSPACHNCYAEGWAKRSGMVKWGPQAERRRTSEANWKQPMKWNAEANRLGVRHRVFCASLADVFDNTVPNEWRADLFKLILQTPNLDWLLLTKRIGNAQSMMAEAGDAALMATFGAAISTSFEFSFSNVWLGATICNQEEAVRDIPKLLAVPAAKRFLSIEPLLGSVDLSPWLELGGLDTELGLSNPGIDWVIVGGESGPGARPMHPDWARSLRDQCRSAVVPFLFKQHGEWLATDFCDDDLASIPSKRTVYVSQDGQFHDGSKSVDFFEGEKETAWVGKKAAGRMLDGLLWDEVPS